MLKYLSASDSAETRPSLRLLLTFDRLLETGDYSDLVLDCQGVRFNVHRIVLCPQSDYFGAICAGSIKVRR